jgi:hypothetical protein
MACCHCPRKTAAESGWTIAVEPTCLPPGFKPKKRGKYMLYCRKETVMGTRFPVEKCYDEAGIRELIRAQIENQEQLDQMRRICSTAGACGSN